MARTWTPLRVRTTVPPASRTVSVMPCAPDADARVPSLRSATAKVSGAPGAGADGVQVTDAATRSELLTGRTTSGFGAV